MGQGFEISFAVFLIILLVISSREVFKRNYEKRDNLCSPKLGVVYLVMFSFRTLRRVCFIDITEMAYHIHYIDEGVCRWVEKRDFVTMKKLETSRGCATSLCTILEELK